jgi:5'-nucleotidase
LLATALLALWLVACGGAAERLPVDTPTVAAAAHHEHAHAEDSLAMREAAQREVTCSGDPQPAEPVAVRILGYNDFHGQISAGRVVGGRPVGGAAVFKAYLDAAAAGYEDRVIVAGAGDMVGASPLSSALLRDEPTLAFLDSLGNAHCRRDDRYAPRCNLVGTPGNHEFDKGRAELLRQLHGGNHADGPFLGVDPWPGPAHGWVSANIVDTASGRPLLPAWTIKQLRYRGAGDGTRILKVGFIGAVLRGTPSIVSAAGIVGLRFDDEANAINAQVGELRRRGVESIVVLIHQGGFQTNYVGDTDAARPTVGGEIVEIVNRLDPAIDVVVSGHAHAFTNALVPNRAGAPVLVTQAFSAGTAYSEIDLQIDPATRDVVHKRARVVTTFADAGPGLQPDAAAASLVAKAEAAVAPLAGRVIARYRGEITRAQTAAGDSALGNLIADAQAATMKTRFAFMNPGGIRADLACAAGAVCDATYGALFTVQPFGNVLTKLELSGAQVKALLEQQWQGVRVRTLQVAGLRYTWDASKVSGFNCNGCIVEVRDAASGAPLDPAARYSVTVNSFLADGGDDFTVLRAGTNREGGPLDLDGLLDYLPTLPQPFAAPPTGARIVRLN